MQLSLPKCTAPATTISTWTAGPPACRSGVAEWSVQLSRRHFFRRGGWHHLHLPAPRPPGADATMRMFNADGSEGLMCGNGVRCVAEFLYTHGLPKDALEIDTRAGRKTLRRLGGRSLAGGHGAVFRHGRRPARGERGRRPAGACGALRPPARPGTPPASAWATPTASSSGRTRRCPPGNALAAIGPAFEHHPVFPRPHQHRVCLCLQPRPRQNARLGAGAAAKTLACGTGACATVAALVLRGVCPRGTPRGGGAFGRHPADHRAGR